MFLVSCSLFLKAEELLDLSSSIIWVSDRMADRPWISIDLIIITTLVCFISKEVDRSVFHPTRLLCLVLQML
jgi:hypothetical protein